MSYGSVRSFLRNRITLASYEGHADAYGTRTYASETTLRARVEYSPKLVRTLDGNEVTARATAWVEQENNIIGTKDKIVLPDGTTPPILTVERKPDDQNRINTKVTFG